MWLRLPMTHWHSLPSPMTVLSIQSLIPDRIYAEIKITKLDKIRLIAKTPSKFEIILILFSTMVYYFRFFIIPNIICYFDFRFFPSISIVKVVFKWHLSSKHSLNISKLCCFDHSIWKKRKKYFPDFYQVFLL